MPARHVVMPIALFFALLACCRALLPKRHP